jgi:hypothetical protein
LQRHHRELARQEKHARKLAARLAKSAERKTASMLAERRRPE